MTAIFSTVHGSHLYGWGTPESDNDRFTVTDSTRRKARQTVNDDEDHVRVGMNTFLIRALGGSHQSVEALFSPYKEWNPDMLALKPFIDNMVVCGRPVYEKYERTIRKFCFGDFKRRRHAARLSLNLEDLRSKGRFNPAMNTYDIEFCTQMAEAFEGEQLWTALTN